MAHRDEFPEYRAVLIAGYLRVGGSAVADLNTFVAAAFVNYLNFGFHSGGPEFRKWVSFSVDMIDQLLG